MASGVRKLLERRHRTERDRCGGPRRTGRPSRPGTVFVGLALGDGAPTSRCVCPGTARAFAPTRAISALDVLRRALERTRLSSTRFSNLELRGVDMSKLVDSTWSRARMGSRPCVLRASRRTSTPTSRTSDSPVGSPRSRGRPIGLERQGWAPRPRTRPRGHRRHDLAHLLDDQADHRRRRDDALRRGPLRPARRRRAWIEALKDPRVWAGGTPEARDGPGDEPCACTISSAT